MNSHHSLIAQVVMQSLALFMLFIDSTEKLTVVAVKTISLSGKRLLHMIRQQAD